MQIPPKMYKFHERSLVFSLHCNAYFISEMLLVFCIEWETKPFLIIVDIFMKTNIGFLEKGGKLKSHF